MIKKILIILLLFIPNSIFVLNTYSAQVNAPTINCFGLPGCTDDKKEEPTGPDISGQNSLKWIGGIISELIKYVSVIAVISVIFSGVLYITSGGEDEKVKKAKHWIIWSLVGVFLSISAWGIINMLNAIKIN